jgi:hypothetical protein
MNNEIAEAIMLLLFLLAGYPIASFINPKRMKRILISVIIGFSLFFAMKGFVFPFL